MKRINIISLFVIITVILTWSTGCQKLTQIEGNGSVVIEERNSVSFNRVNNQGVFSVYIIPDTVTYLEIEAESNLIPHIKTTVHGNTLEIDTRENLSSNHAMIIRVHTPSVASVVLSGSGLINVSNLDTDEFEAILSGSGVIYGDVIANTFRSSISGSGEIDFVIDSDITTGAISGSGNIILSGTSNFGDYRISGSGNIDAYTLPIAECYAKISGSGNIYTMVSDLLTVNITGSGNLYYRGNPTINQNISGSGQIIGQ